MFLFFVDLFMINKNSNREKKTGVFSFDHTLLSNKSKFLFGFVRLINGVLC